MSALSEKEIPRLTDAVADAEQSDERDDAQDGAPGRAPDAFIADLLGDRDLDALIAELQTAIAAKTFRLTDELMREAFAEMEARVFQRISSSLRRDLPELIDAIIRAELGKREEED